MIQEFNFNDDILTKKLLSFLDNYNISTSFIKCCRKCNFLYLTMMYVIIYNAILQKETKKNRVAVGI